MDILKFQYMHKNDVLADVTIDLEKRKVSCVNYTDDIILRPFGRRLEPTMGDFMQFLEDRCFPRERRNCKQLLADLALKDYVPLSILEKTHGRQLEDYCWVKFEGEELDYERDIKLRD